jgi:hypothetical protein
VLSDRPEQSCFSPDFLIPKLSSDKADVFFHRLKPPLSFFSKSFIFVAIFTLVAQGCNKDGPTTQLPVLPRDGGGANCANMINHAELTDLTYKHIKYWQASFDNFIYVPQNVRATFQ